jgi:polyadenylate-binding protein
MPSSPISPVPTLHSTIMRQASSSSSGSSAPTGESSEKDRFLTVIRPLAVNSREAESLADLLLSLSKKDRALCLFNPDHLALKVADARTVLAAVDSPQASNAYPTPRPTPETRSAAKFSSIEPTWTMMSLAALPAGKILEMVHSENPPPIVANPDPTVVADTDSFMDSLIDKPEHEQKQKLGEKLFKVVKSLGFKSSVRSSSSKEGLG